MSDRHHVVMESEFTAEQGVRCNHCGHPNWPGDYNDGEWSTCDGQCTHTGGETRELVENGIWRDRQAQGRTVREREIDSQLEVLCDICWKTIEDWRVPESQLGL